MFLKFIGLGRKTEPAQRPTKREKFDDTSIRKSSPGQTEEDRKVPFTNSTGRDSLSKLKSVARGQQATEQGRGRWFGKPEDSSRGYSPVAKPEKQDDAANCPVIPEAERLKAIESLLGIGIDHFTVKLEE